MTGLLNGETFLYPIIGDPIVYVKSPQRLTEKFSERGHNGICMPMEVHQPDLAQVLNGLLPIANVRGLLITMPHKNAMFEHCKTASTTATLLNVVSVARRNPDGSWHGDMLDGLSFVVAMKKNGAHLNGARVLQMGAGGAGSAIAIALLNEGVREIILFDQNRRRVDELISMLSTLAQGRLLAGPPDPSGCDIVVNATPMGMTSSDPLPVSTELLRPTMFVGDVIAGHGVTPLLQAARAIGCKTSDGIAMVEAGMELMPDFFLAPDHCD